MSTHAGGRTAAALAAGSNALKKDGTTSLTPLFPSAASLCLSGAESEASCEASCVTVAEAKSGESSGGVAVAEGGKGGDESALQTGESAKAEAYSEPGTSSPRAEGECKSEGGGQRSLGHFRSGESLASEGGREPVGEEGAAALLNGGASASESKSEGAPGLLEGAPSSGASESESEDGFGAPHLEAVCALAAHVVESPSEDGAPGRRLHGSGVEEEALGKLEGKEGDAAVECTLLEEGLLPGIEVVCSGTITVTAGCSDTATVANLVTVGSGAEALVPADILGSGVLKAATEVKAEPEPLVMGAVAVTGAATSEGEHVHGTTMPEGYDDSTLDCRLSAAEKWVDMLECGAEDILQFTYEDIAGPINQVCLPEPAIVAEAFPEDSTGTPDLDHEPGQDYGFGREAMGVLEGMGAIGGIGEMGMGGLGAMEIANMGAMDPNHENELRGALNSASGSLRNLKGGAMMDWENLALPEIYDFCAAPCTPALPPRQSGGGVKRKGMMVCDSGSDVGDGNECGFDGDYEAFCREMEAEGLALAPVPVKGRSKRVRKSTTEWAPKFLTLLHEKGPGKRRGGALGSSAGAGAGVAVAGGSPFPGAVRSPGTAGPGTVALGGAEVGAAGMLVPGVGSGTQSLQSQASGEEAGSQLANRAHCVDSTSGALFGAGAGNVSSGAPGQIQSAEAQAVGVTGGGQGQSQVEGPGQERKQGPSNAGPAAAQKAHVSGSSNKRGNPYTETGALRRCSHCATTKTPQWRAGPNGPKTLCNACGVRYKSGRLCAEYRPASSPEFEVQKHSNSHRRIVEMRKMRDGGLLGAAEGEKGGPHGTSALSKSQPTTSGSKKVKKSATQSASQAPKPKKAAAGPASFDVGGSRGQKVQSAAQAQAQAQVQAQSQGQGQGQEVRVRSQRLQQKKQMRQQQELEQQQQEQQQEQPPQRRVPQQRQHSVQQTVQQHEQHPERQGRPKGKCPEQAQTVLPASAQGQAHAETSSEQSPQGQADIPPQAQAQPQPQPQAQVQKQKQPQLPSESQAQASAPSLEQSVLQSQLQPSSRSPSQTEPKVEAQAGPEPVTPRKLQAATASGAEGSTLCSPCVRSPATKALSLSPVTVLGPLGLSPVTVSDASAAAANAGHLTVHSPASGQSGRVHSPVRIQPSLVGTLPPVTNACHKSEGAAADATLSSGVTQPNTAAAPGGGPSSLSAQSQVTPGRSQSQVTTPTQSPASIISVRVLVGEGAAEAAQRPPSVCCIELGKQFVGEALGREKKVAGNREKEGAKGKENEGAVKGGNLVVVGKVAMAGGGGGLPTSLVSKGTGGALFAGSVAKDMGASVQQGQRKAHQGQQGEVRRGQPHPNQHQHQHQVHGQGQQWQSPRKVNQMRASACPSNLPPLSYILPHKARPKQDLKPQVAGFSNAMPDTPTPTGSPAKASAKETGNEAGNPTPVASGLGTGAVTGVAAARATPLAVPPATVCGPKTPATPATVTPASATVAASPLSGPKTPASGMGEPTVGAPWEDRGSERRFSMRESVRVQA